MLTIIFALLAFYIFFKLSQQLGKIDEEEKKQIQEKLAQQKAQFMAAQKEIFENLKKQQEQSQENQALSEEKLVGQGSTKNIAEEKILSSLDEVNRQNLINILARCNMKAEFFLNGAKSAFEMIIKSFAGADIETLKFLLSEKIFKGFEVAILQRKAQEKILTTNLIAIEKVEIISALMIENTASIAVKFVSKQINYISDKEGKIIEGRKDEISSITDIWTFTRDITSSNPNWIVSATNSN